MPTARAAIRETGRYWPIATAGLVSLNLYSSCHKHSTTTSTIVPIRYYENSSKSVNRAPALKAPSLYQLRADKVNR
jgi:hypothetical protein